MNNSTFQRTDLVELDQLRGYVCLQTFGQMGKSSFIVGKTFYSAHVAPAPSNSSVKLTAAGFDPGLKPLGSR